MRFWIFCRKGAIQVINTIIIIIIIIIIPVKQYIYRPSFPALRETLFTSAANYSEIYIALCLR